MNKKNLTRILAVFVVLVSACQTTEQKEAEKRRDDLVNNGGLELFTKPPSANETIIKAYKDGYQTQNSGDLNVYAWQPYRYYNNSSAHTNLHPANKFSPVHAAYILLAKAKKEFPDIDINELDVRSIKQIGDTFFNMFIADKPDKNGYYSFRALNLYEFEGVVVRVKN